MIKKKNTNYLIIILFFPSLFFLLEEHLEILYKGIWAIIVISYFLRIRMTYCDLKNILMFIVLFFVNFFIFSPKLIILRLGIIFFLKCYIMYVILSKKINFEYFIKKSYQVAILGNFLLSINYFIFNSSMSYMAFGYRTLPCVLIYFYEYYFKKKKIALILFSLNTIIISIYGGRGPFFSLLIFLLINYFLFYKNKIVKWSSLIITTTLFILLNTNYMKIKIVEIIQYLIEDLNLKTYALYKLMLLLERGIASASSGRDILYKNAINLGNKNIMFGNGIGSFRKIYETYPHNILLEIYVQFGLVGILLICLIIFKIIKKLKKGDINEKVLIIILFSLSVPRLTFSSSFWERPEFWGLIGLAFKKYKYRKEY